jgi:hypothetical protein
MKNKLVIQEQIRQAFKGGFLNRTAKIIILFSLLFLIDKICVFFFSSKNELPDEKGW